LRYEESNMLSGREGKKQHLHRIHHMGRKAHDLIPESQVVRSAILYLHEIENFFKENSNNQVAVYPLLSFALHGRQDETQANMISGRLFYNLSCFIQKDPEKGIMEKSNKEFNTKDPKYNFVSEAVLKKLDDMLKTRDVKQVNEILKNLANDIDKNPIWIKYWQKRAKKEGVDKELINKVTQALTYKIAGACHEAYVLRNNPSYEQQRTDAKLISVFKTSALQVTSSLSLEKPSRSKKEKKIKSKKKKEKTLLKQLSTLEDAAPKQDPLSTTHEAVLSAPPPSPITTQYAISQKTLSEQSRLSSGRVKQMIGEYEDKHITPPGKSGINKRN